jgi:hypothetical protein
MGLCFNGAAGVKMKLATARVLASILVCLLSATLAAQSNRREPLSEAQIEEIRAAGGNPSERINLYTKYLKQRAEILAGLNKRAHSPARAQRIHEELLDFTALLDELTSNLDQYGDRKADLRPALKLLNEALPHWLEAARAFSPEPAFELAQKESIASAQDLKEQAADLLKEQTAYFNAHKDEKNQERAEPK